jgi:hypothetical protein
MSFITSEQLQRIIDLPVSLPLTTLDPSEWLVISSVTLVSPERMILKWLQSEILILADIYGTVNTATSSPNADGQCVFLGGGATLNTPSLGLAFIGLYRDFDPLKQPSSQAAQEAPLVVGTSSSLPPIAGVRATTPTTYTDPGTYSFVVVNNTSDRKVSIAVTGQVRVDLGS